MAEATSPDPQPDETPVWYKDGTATGNPDPDTQPIADANVVQPSPRRWYQFPPWGPGWPHVVGALALSTAALGFSIASFSMALVVLIRMH